MRASKVSGGKSCGGEGGRRVSELSSVAVQVRGVGRRAARAELTKTTEPISKEWTSTETGLQGVAEMTVCEETRREHTAFCSFD